MLQISLYLGTKDSDSELCCEQFAGSWDSNIAGKKYEKMSQRLQNGQEKGHPFSGSIENSCVKLSGGKTFRRVGSLMLQLVQACGWRKAPHLPNTFQRTGEFSCMESVKTDYDIYQEETKQTNKQLSLNFST